MLTRSLVYHLGVDAGFFSEYNNMLLALEFCDKHKILFKLFSDDANFGFEKGWQDYFIPFCPEVHEAFHHTMNYRFPEKSTTVLLKRYVKSLRNVFHFNAKYKVRCLVPFSDSRETRSLKKTYGFSFFTQDLWDDFQHYVTPSREGVKVLHLFDKRVWKYNEQTEAAVREKIEQLHLPSEYASVHIRRGDKIEESRYFEVSEYMRLVEERTNCKSVFVATDDYSVFEELVKEYPQYSFFSNANSNMSGHYQGDYNRAPGMWKREQMFLLLSDVEIMSKSSYFIGSYRSNIGQYMMIRREGQSCSFVDYYISEVLI